jgi:SpoVK/Ycf46/Vps4 family AAA+-type ATPase
LEEEDFSDGEGTSSKQNGVSKLYSTKRSRQVLLDEDDFATENQQQKEEQNEYNDSIHVKTRRQQQTEEDSAPPAKRPHLSESEEEDVGPRYPFRQNRARVIRLEEQMATLNGKRGRRSVHFRRRSSRRRRRNSSYSSESSSTSDSDIADAEKDYRAELKFEKRKLRSLQKGRSRFVPLNMSQKEWDETEKLNRLTSKHILDGVQAIGDIEPMGIDKSVSFDNIGGLDEHIQSLKEAVVFPLLYPELFEKFQIAPPKGVLFYGKYVVTLANLKRYRPTRNRKNVVGTGFSKRVK